MTDVLGRYGGEEFMVFVPHTSIEGARLLAERLRRAVRDAPFDFGGDTLALTVSIGVAASGPEDANIESPIGRADEALYRAKEAGRDCVITG